MFRQLPDPIQYQLFRGSYEVVKGLDAVFSEVGLELVAMRGSDDEEVENVGKVKG